MSVKQFYYVCVCVLTGFVCVAGSMCLAAEQNFFIERVTPARLVQLRVEGIFNPLGVGTATPRFGWAVEDSRRGAAQTAYQVLVADSPENLKEGGKLLWDSGKVSGDQSQWIAYAGTALKSAQRFWWTVRIWDQNGMPTAFAAPAWAEIGLLNLSDWKAKWIADSNSVPTQNDLVKTWTEYAAETGAHRESAIELLWNQFPTPPQFRKEFQVPGKILSARLYLSVRGYAVTYLNGKRVGDRVLDPAFLPYDYQAHYVVHDVTGLLQSGSNAIGVLLAGGWHGIGGTCKINAVLNKRKRNEAFAAELRISTDRGDFTVGSDGSWKAAAGPLLKSVFFVGECYDATRETAGWNSTGFDDSKWHPAAEVEVGSPRLQPMLIAPERVIRILKPVKKTSPYPGIWIYDFGELFAGRTRLHLKDAPKDTMIIQRYAQWVDTPATSKAWYPTPDVRKAAKGSIPNDANGAHGGNAESEAAYIYRAAGKPVEEWAPEFDYQSMRFVEVIGYPGEPPDDLLTGEVIHSDFQRVGSVKTSDERLNRMHQFLIETLRHTTHGILQDNNCQEREQGTTAWNNNVLPFDMYEHDFYQYQCKALDGLRVNSYNGIATIEYHNVSRNPPGPNRKPEDVASSAANVHAPWLAWLYYGDPKIWKDHYETSAAFVDSFEMPLLEDRFVGWGDWSDVNLNPDGKRPITPDIKHGAGSLFDQVRAGTVKPTDSNNWPPLPLNTPIALSEGQCFVAAVDRLAFIARLLGKDQDAARFLTLSSKVSDRLRKEYYNEGKHSFGSQSGDAYALMHGQIPPSEIPAVTTALHDDFAVKNKGHLTGGFLAAYVPTALSKGEFSDDALRVFTADDYPSFGQICFTFGLNMMSARWPMSADQPNYARMIQGEKVGVGRWFYDGLGGISPTEEVPGFKKTILMPSVPQGLEWVEISYHSFYGDIVSNWRKEHSVWMWNVHVPPNTTAEIRIPLVSGAQTVRESGTIIWQKGVAAETVPGLTFVRNEKDRSVFNAVAGIYEFVVQ